MTALCQILVKGMDFLKSQHQQVIGGNQVYFPFNPYESQTDYMAKVIQACNAKQNALLESPTGTGKTLSLLCASLAWLKTERERLVREAGGAEIPSEGMPKIIYCSRTHSQLAQVQKELKNTVFQPRTVLIASRDHLCANQSINMARGFALNAACRAAQGGMNPCLYFKNRDKADDIMSWEPHDIEELHRIAQKQQVCPFFANKDRASVADVIFMPYNYLVEEKIRENFEIGYANSVIIFDEAHNIAPVTEEVSSFQLKAKLLEQTLTELHDLREESERRGKKDSESANGEKGERGMKSRAAGLAYIKVMTERFLKHLRKLSLETADHPKAIRGASENRYLPGRSVVLPGDQIFDIVFDGTKGEDIDSEGEYV